jgi:hypothetical protein
MQQRKAQFVGVQGLYVPWVFEWACIAVLNEAALEIECELHATLDDCGDSQQATHNMFQCLRKMAKELE